MFLAGIACLSTKRLAEPLPALRLARWLAVCVRVLAASDIRFAFLPSLRCAALLLYRFRLVVVVVVVIFLVLHIACAPLVVPKAIRCCRVFVPFRTTIALAAARRNCWFCQRC